MTFELPELPYAYDALQLYMSAETLEYHHDKHHNKYVTTANDIIGGTGLENKSLEEAMVAAYKDPSKEKLFNQLGQHFNHIHFWNWMKPDGGGTSIPGNLEQKIKEDLGGYDEFRGRFIEAGKGQFGSGWCWLVLDDSTGRLDVMKTPNGENPVVHGKTPILGCDVWEHSYYIDYRNARPKYLEAFVDNLINWEYVAERFEQGPLKIAA